MNLTKKQLNRFWSYVDKKSVEECWEWKSYKGAGNYGHFYLNGKQIPAHRISWILENGPIPENDSNDNRICACHKCDNPSCVNPNHLFLGTDLDNMKDRDRKGRRTPFSPIGNKNGNSTVSIETIKEIELLLKQGSKNVEIANQLDVSEALVSNVKHKNHWSQRQGST